MLNPISLVPKQNFVCFFAFNLCIQNDRFVSKFWNICEIRQAHMTNEVPYSGFHCQGTWSGDSWCSVGWGELCADCTRGVQSRQDAAFPWWLDPTTVGQMASPQLEINIRNHTQVIPSPSLTHFISLFSPRWCAYRSGATYLPTRSHSFNPHGPPSLVPLPPPQFISFSSHEGVPTSTRRKFWQLILTSGEPHLLLSIVYIPPASSWPKDYAPDFASLLMDRGDQMVLGDFKAHHPSWYSRTGDDRAAARERNAWFGDQ